MATKARRTPSVTTLITSNISSKRELEGEGRGFFTGSAGFIDLRGNARFNILIRTLCWRPTGAAGEGEVRYHVGGGITWSSDAKSEDAEMKSQGRA